MRDVSVALTLQGANRFRILAYEKAADTIEASTTDIKDFWKQGKLSELPGIGSAMISHLDDLFRKGKVAHLENILRKIPSTVFPLLPVSGFGPKKAYKLVTILKLKNPKSVVKDLLEAAKSGKIAPIEGFGEKSQQDILESLKRFLAGQGKKVRMSLPLAASIADNLIIYLKTHKDTVSAIYLGSLRRFVATIGDIDIAVVTSNPKGLIDWFLLYPKKEKPIEKGPTGASILLDNGRQIDLRVCAPSSFGAMLQYFTGSKNHNLKLRELALKKGLSLNEYGVKTVGRYKIQDTRYQKFYNPKNKLYEFAKEEDLYGALGLNWIPPELREDKGEIEASLRSAQGKPNGLPKLVNLSDIKGDLHLHSNYDLSPSHDLGTSSIEQILKQADKMGYEYIGISDHNPSYTNHTKNQIIAILKARKQRFEQILESTKITRVNLLIMLEVDILPDGKLPLPNEAFDYLGAIIVSIHSSFNMDREIMTKRILSGLSHPKAKILAHPTGRLIGLRESYQVNWEEIFKFCKENNKALEINAHPTRLDLPDQLVSVAKKAGVKMVIDTDSHDVSQMELMRYGVSVARRGWATKDDIFNTMPYNKFKEWLLK